MHILWQRQKRTRLGVVFCASFMSSCATVGGSADGPAAVRVSVISSTAGLSWSWQPASGLTVEVGDFAGTNATFSWSSVVLADTDRLPALDSCLDKLRMAVRFADPETITEPHFIRSAAIHCFESAGMPASVSTHDHDAREYDVQLTTGNVRDSTEREPGVRLSASGGPYLGARRHIRTNAADPTTVVSDVTECRDRAAAGGVFTTTRMSGAPDSAGWQMSFGHTTIQPMVDRFDQCLKNRGYGVESAKN